MEDDYLEYLLNTYSKEVECVYKSETFSVRDNGAIMRHPKEGVRPRPNDNKWTFGRPSEVNGYMLFCSERVHRIVATAFHGEAPTKDHVVDHIDTNRQNNRADNLRWLSKLENILNNEITRSKIEYICGSIENFLKNPSLLRDHIHEDRNFGWMRAVSKEEAENSLANIKEWLKNAPKAKEDSDERGKIGDWIYEKKSNKDNFMKGYQVPELTEEQKKQQEEAKQRILLEKKKREEDAEKQRAEQERKFEEEMERLREERRNPIQSITPNCMQIDWKTPMDFICCPQSYGEFPLEDYANALQNGAVYAKSSNYESKVEFFILDDDKRRLWVVSHLGMWAYGIAEITFKEGIFYHEYLNRFETSGACDQWITTELQGKEWDGYDCLENE
ncbi:MAG: HNH endonuclease [Paludibacteraceae bacterium]|nr:HNH endonuclease [Paludibacteraceae bacterium]